MSLYRETKIIHYPSMKTILEVEKVLKLGSRMKREEIKKKLEKKIMHQTLNVVLKFLEERDLIEDGKKGVLWKGKRDIVIPIHYAQ